MSHPFLTKLSDIARFHFQANRMSEAEAACRELLQHDPANAEADYLLARILMTGNRYAAALEILEPMARSHPELRFISDDCRQAFIRASRAEEGAKCFKQLSDGHPELLHLHLNLAMLYREINQHEEAGACLAEVLAMDPEHVEALYLLGQDAVRRFEFIAGESLLRKAADLAPSRPDILNVLAGILKTLGRADEADHIYRRAVDMAPGDSRLYANYLMNFLCTDRPPEYSFERHLVWASDKVAQHVAAAGQHTNLPDPGRRLRVGYVSADFRCHPVAFFIEPILSLHDRDQVEVYCYAQLEAPDFITEQIRSRDIVWRPITELSDREAAQLIRDDGIDILVDLNGHTASSRLLVFALKPAPVQVTWLGYAHSTGLDCIDYRFTDLVADPPGLTEHLHSERLYRLPGSFICYHPPQDPPPVSELPFLRNGFITFGAFNNMAKWTPAMLDLWCAILGELPDSRFLIKGFGPDYPQLSEYVISLFARRGVEARRLVLQGRVPTVVDHLRCFNEADIALDCFPYNSTTTTCESLFMGVPLVTLSGSSHISRVGASILAASGMEELIAGTPKRYLETAVALAGDQKRLQRYRLGLREQVSASPFFQVEQFTRNLETAYRDIWQTWCGTRR